MRELQPLRLPQIVQARKVQVACADSPASESSPNTNSAQSPHSPTHFQFSSPPTPNSSMRELSAIQSCAVPVTFDPLDKIMPIKRPLTEVREEVGPEEDVDAVDREVPESREKPTEEVLAVFDKSVAQEISNIIHPSTSDYDLRDHFDNPLDMAFNPAVKRRRGADFVLTGLTARFGTRFPSLSHKIRPGKRNSSPSPHIEGPQDYALSRASLSRANSTRAPSIAGSCKDIGSMHEIQTPPTPTKSVTGDPTSPGLGAMGFTDVKKADEDPGVEDRDAKATTPLLPPVLTNIGSSVHDVPYQSPLQSPAVADYDLTHALVTPSMSPQATGLPSPPLSTKPSVASFHRGRGLSQLPPTSEIPVLPLVDPDNLWANQLGHADFHIEPQPYLPDPITWTTYQQFMQDWDTARQNYLRHLMRTSEHNGPRSKIYRLTEEKWAEVESQWRKDEEQCQARVSEERSSHEMSSSHASIAAPAPLITLPSLNGPLSQGKFPQLGDENIVGPMAQAPSPKAPKFSSKRKRTFLKFLQGMLPSGSGVFGRSSSGERSPS